MRPHLHKACFPLIGACLVALPALAAGWNAPGGTPPNANAPEPINVSAIDQFKQGTFGAKTLNIFGTSQYLSFGNAVGSGQPGIRFNTTTSQLEFSNGGGAWSSIGSGGGLSQWTTTGSNIYYAAGNVGVGTSNPQAKIDAAGGSEAIYSRSTAGSPYTFLGNSGTYGRVGAYSPTTGWQNLILAEGGNVGIGTTSPGTKLDIADDTGARILLRAAANTQLRYSTDRSGIQGWSFGQDASDSNKFKIASWWDNLQTNTRLAIDTSGNVGIGTTSPSAILSVGSNGGTNGKVTLNGSTSGSVSLQAAAAAGSAAYTLPSADGSSGQVLSTNGSGTLSWATASAGGPNRQVFNASGTWTKPASGSLVVIEVWGGGGAGGKSYGFGGGGGGYTRCERLLADLTATVTVSVGSGGGPVTAANATGNTGGTSSFGTYCYAYGGLGGTRNVEASGYGSGSGGGSTPAAATDDITEGRGCVYAMIPTDIPSYYWTSPTKGFWKGGGGGCTGDGAMSAYGGGGGGGAGYGVVSAGGASINGGAGGASGVTSAGLSGTQPGGGGGGTHTGASSGAGGPGRVIVTVW